MSTNELNNYRILMQGQCKKALQNVLINLVNSIAANQIVRDTEYSYENDNVKVAFTIRLSFEFGALVNLVCNDLKVNPNIVVGNCKIKNRKVVIARDVIIYLLRYRYGYTLSTIVKLMKMKCNGSVIFACKKINSENLPDVKACSLQHGYYCVKRNHLNFAKVCVNE